MNRRLLRNRLAVLAFLVILGAAATAFLAPHLPSAIPTPWTRRIACIHP